MSKKKILILIIIIVLIIGGLIVWKITSKVGLDKELIKINTNLQMSEAQKNSYDEIINKLKKDTKDYDSLFGLARLKQDLLDFDGALKIYKKLQEVRPKDVLLFNNMGTIYYQTKQYEEAEKSYLAILDITPKWINSYTELMSIYQYSLTDKKDKIEPLLLNGLENFPEMKADLLSLLAVYYDEIVPNKNKAIEYYQKVVEENPGNAAAVERLKGLKR